jgi:hypothetical protein
MKLETKDIIIIALVIFCIWIYFNPFNNDKIKDLEKDNNDKQTKISKIEFTRDSLKSERVLIDGELKKLKELSNLRSDTINFYKKISTTKGHEIKILRESLDTYEEMLEKREKQIDELIKNPIVLPKNKLVEKTSEKLK